MPRKQLSAYDKSVHLHASFAMMKFCPKRYLKTYSYRSTVKSINHLIQAKAKVVFVIQLLCPLDENLSIVSVNHPIPFPIGFC